MKFVKFGLCAIASLLAACSGGGGSSGSRCSVGSFAAQSFPNVGTTGTNANVMTVTVNGTLCGNSQYPNEPCASVTLCSTADPTNCQTIDNLLVDTGSYGLRVFSSVITVPLSPVVSGSTNLAECVQFADGTSMWGPVQYGYVQLGGEPKIAMPIQVVNAAYGNAPGPCSRSQSVPNVSPAQDGFNGILGVGLRTADCGAECATDADNGQYYGCQGSDCSCGATPATNVQVQNPVGLQPTDNNGVIMTLPSVSSSAGVSSLSGTLTLGIGTQSNNAPSGVTTYPVDGYDEFRTVFTPYRSATLGSFIDSGSNAFYFPPPTSGALTDCGNSDPSYAGFFCPASPQSLSATNKGSTGTPSGSVSFSIGNAISLMNSSNNVFGNLGGDAGDVYFDWGLPFFFGRSVYVGIEGKSSTLGTGPYWAY